MFFLTKVVPRSKLNFVNITNFFTTTFIHKIQVKIYVNQFSITS